MKLIILAMAALFTISLSASAGTSELGAVMKTMADDLGRVAAQAGDATKNSESATLVEDLLKQVAAAKTLVPAKVSALPQADQAKQLTDYAASLDGLSAILVKLEAAFKANDNAGAAALLGDVKKAKTAGHAAFKS